MKGREKRERQRGKGIWKEKANLAENEKKILKTSTMNKWNIANKQNDEE